MRHGASLPRAAEPVPRAEAERVTPNQQTRICRRDAEERIGIIIARGSGDESACVKEPNELKSVATVIPLSEKRPDCTTPLPMTLKTPSLVKRAPAW
jgi:hypothetical protein